MAGRGRSGTCLLGGDGSVIDVIVPVYRGYDDTLACLFSVLAAPDPTPFELIVINDQSPELHLAEALDRLAAMDLFTLLTNDINCGFVGSVNRGMRLHPNRDVVLLNSDTEVHGNWLERMREHARVHRIGTVTPLSNNATICSYPRINADNIEPLELEYAELDALAAKVNKGKRVDLPTGVGFCMYIRRETLDRYGYFDQEAFGRGYGEENDFCMRLIKNGWANVLALDVFVRHTGETSFGVQAGKAQQQGMRVLTERHPDYMQHVRQHIATNPAASGRRRLDLARLKRRIGGDSTKLCVVHNWGGGISRYITDEAMRLAEEGIGVALLAPVHDLSTKLRLDAVNQIALPNLEGFDMAGRIDELAEALRELDVRQIEISSLVGWPPQALDALPRLARSLGVSYGVMLHDYAPVCPQINLIDASGFYCGELGAHQCAACLVGKGDPALRVHGSNPFGGDTIRIETWRQAYLKLLTEAAWVKAPSRDAATRFMRYFPQLDVRCVPHREQLPLPDLPVAAPYTGTRTLRVAVIGAIGLPKGSRVLAELACDAQDRGLDIEFVVVGYTDIDDDLEEIGNVTITGRYVESEVFAILRDQHCHIALLPSVWPETYSYTFSVTRAAGLPTIAFSLGALAERAANVPEVALAPLALAKQPAEFNNFIIAFARRVANLAECEAPCSPVR